MLKPPDSFHLDAAWGWLELGDHIQANEELEKITARLRAHPDVLDVRWQIHAKAKKWDTCVEIAEAMVKLAPGRANGWIHRSFALHELGRTQEAFDNLLPVADKFAAVWTIPYNLACYCAKLRRLGQCHKWFKRAMAIDKRPVQRAALDDPDLKLLWDSMTRW